MGSGTPYYLSLGFWFKLFIITASLFILKIFLHSVSRRYEKRLLLLKCRNWLTSKKDLLSLKTEDFNEWCASLLLRSGYKFVRIVSKGIDGGKDIVCFNGISKIYVECRQMGICSEGKSLDKNLDNDERYEKIGRPDLQMFLGQMVHDGIYEGIVMTTGYFSTEAREFALKLPDGYKIELIDGDNMMLQHWQLLENRA